MGAGAGDEAGAGAGVGAGAEADASAGDNVCAGGSDSKTDELFMKEALKCARRAFVKGEAPVGAVVVRDGIIVSRAYNEREAKQDATLHAEMTAIRRACKKIGYWRLTGCDLYVTLEPCAMCAGAIVLSRLDRVVYGAADQKAGACGTVMDVPGVRALNHHPIVVSGVLREECAELLTNFFSNLRTK